jgi:uncharacterized protein YraI
MALVIASACVSGRVSRLPATLVPTKTLRPTFTPTQPKAEQQPTATVAPAVAEATPEPAQPPAEATATPAPTEAPTATEAAPEPEFTVNSQTVNVRSGPGTNYAIIGKLAQGERRPLLGTNNAGDWWQFDYDGRQGWVSGQNVSVTAADRVEVAADIPAPPTARPRPTARPQPVQPAQPTQPAQPAQPAPAPAPATLFAQAGSEFRNADNTNFEVVTFWGRLGKTSEAPISGYKLRVSAPGGTLDIPFGVAWEWAGTEGSRYLYNAKAEVRRAGGGFRAVVVDGSGAEVSEAVSGTLLDQTHDVIISWLRR